MFAYWAILILLQAVPYDPAIDAGISGEAYDGYTYDPAIDSVAGVDREMQMYDPDWVDPMAIAEIAPEYPFAYYADPIDATVLVDVYVDRFGMVTMANVVSSAGQEFDTAALEAVYGWIFQPAMLKNEPTKSVITIPVRFTPDMIPGWEEPEYRDRGSFLDAFFPEDDYQ
jgi:protein TonB